MSIELITTIIGLGKSIYKEIKENIDKRNLKGKYVILSMISGPPIYGKFIDYMKMGEEISLKINILPDKKDVIVPIKNISFLEFYSNESKIEKRHVYGIPPVKYTLSDFPKPFISDTGLDVVFVYGTSPLDYDDYKKYIQQRGESLELRTAFQRIGDFDQLLTLAANFGFESARSSYKIKENVCYGRQDFTLTDAEKRKHNLLLVGSGYSNRITKEVLEYYQNLPIRFEAPSSHQAIIFMKEQDVEVYDRTLTGKDVGMIALLPNPFNPEKVVLIAGGPRPTGTQAALLLLHEAFEKRIYSITENVPEILVRARKMTNILGKPVVEECEIINYITIK